MPLKNNICPAGDDKDRFFTETVSVMLATQRKTLLKLHRNKPQDHAQPHSESVTKMSSLCSLAVTFHFTQSREL